MNSKPKNYRNIYKTQTESTYSKSSNKNGNSYYTQRDISPGELNTANTNCRTEKESCISLHCCSNLIRNDTIYKNKHSGVPSESNTFIREDNERSISCDRKSDNDAKYSYNPNTSYMAIKNKEKQELK